MPPRGGTTLAARWRHGDSFDVDLTVSPGANLGSLRPRLDEAMTALGGAADYRRGQWTIDFDTGHVDLSSALAGPADAQRRNTCGQCHRRQRRVQREPVRAFMGQVVRRAQPGHRWR